MSAVEAFGRNEKRHKDGDRSFEQIYKEREHFRRWEHIIMYL